MAMGGWPEGNCCYGHPAGSALHTPPKVNGKPFRAAEYRTALESAGLSVFKQELADEAGKKPPGSPKKINGVLVYPARHFA